MIKDDQYFYQRKIFIKMAKPLLILLRISESNQPHMEKLRFMVPMVDDNIRMSMPELNYEDYLPPETQLEDYEYKEYPGEDDPPKYLSYDEYVSNTEDSIPSEDKNGWGGKILAVWERYKPLLEHHYHRAGYILSVDSKTYKHAKVSFQYIFVNNHVIFLQFIILKII